MEIQWAALVIQTVSPILLIHGNDSEPEFFNRQGFSNFLRDNYWPHDGCAVTEPAADGCDNPIPLLTGAVESFKTEDGDSTKGNDEVLAELIPPIVKTFGVDSIHLVVHSKGGLDSRAYLVNHQPSLNNQFEVLSYTSLSTPHHGSVGADLEIAYRDALEQAGASVEFENLPELTEALAELLEANPGTPYLTSSYVAQFNITNRPELPRSIEYQTVAADADSDGNFVINDVAEYDGFRKESLALWVASSVAPNYTTRRINALYQIMRFTSAVSLTKTTLKFGGFEPDVVSFVIEGHPVDNPEGNPNDLMVTVPSGHGLGTAQQTTFDVANKGRDHANVADKGVAELVDDWILFVEKSHELGDLDNLKK